MNETTTPGGATLAMFAGAVMIGGTNFLAVRFSNRELDPFWGAGLRFTLAATIFVVVVSVLRLRWPRGSQLGWTVLYGILSFTLSYALMYWALVRVTAAMAALILAMVPVVTPLLAWVQRLERIERRTVVGALVALAGIVAMTVDGSGLTLPLSGLVAMLLAALIAGQSVIVSKRVSDNHPAMTNAVGMLVGGPLLVAFSGVAGEQWVLPREPEVVASVAYLVTLGSVGLFVLFLLVIRRWTVAATAYAFVLFPVVAMLLEAWLTEETLTIRGVVGAAIVMAGVWFGALAPARRSGREPEVAQPSAATVE